MKKDVTVAIIVGFVIGGIAALGIVNVPALLKKNSTPTAVSQSVTPQPTPQVTPLALALEIAQPADQSIASSKNADIRGKTLPESLVVLDTDEDNTSTRAGNDGSFKFQAPLREGSNVLTITTYNDKADSESKTLTVYYTSEDL